MESRGPAVRIRYEGVVEEGGSDKSPMPQQPRWSGGSGCWEELATTV